MKDTDIAWAAGLLEGEGSFAIKTGGNSLRVTCEMTDLDVLQSLESLFSGKIFKVTKRQEHWKDTWRWSVCGEEARICMETILPYMHTRRSERITKTLNIRSEYELNRHKNKQEYEQFKDLIIDDYKNGKGSIRVLAVKYGVSRSAVHRWVLTLKD